MMSTEFGPLQGYTDHGLEVRGDCKLKLSARAETGCFFLFGIEALEFNKLCGGRAWPYLILRFACWRLQIGWLWVAAPEQKGGA